VEPESKGAMYNSIFIFFNVLFKGYGFNENIDKNFFN
jgi:hypothetical protein